MSEDIKCNDVKINDVKSICTHIDQLSQDEIMIVLKYCKGKNVEFKTRELESKCIELLKNKYKNYPQLVKFVDGLKFIKCEKYEKNMKIHCNFEIEFCNVKNKCTNDECVHLKMYCDGENEDANGIMMDFLVFEYIYYHITSVQSREKDKVIGFYYSRDEFDFYNEAIAEIMNVFLFDRQKFELKQKSCFGVVSKSENILNYFLKDIVGTIAETMYSV